MKMPDLTVPPATRAENATSPEAFIEALDIVQ